MTNIEMEVARTQFRANLAIANKFGNVDWEERRYELAKTVMHALLCGKSCYPSTDDAVNKAVEYADALINKLKENENKNNY